MPRLVFVCFSAVQNDRRRSEVKWPFLSTVTLVASLGLAPQSWAGGYDADATLFPANVDQMIVKLGPIDGPEAATLTPSRLARLREKTGIALELRRRMSGDAWVLRLPGPVAIDKAEAIAEQLTGLRDVVIAEPDRILYPMLHVPQVTAPNDPLLPEQWPLTDPNAGINLLSAWDLTTGSAAVHVAVLDTGILGSHEDLAGQWAGGYDFISLPLNARDGDRRDNDPSDEGDRLLFNTSSWHGSHVAGTIAAASNNGLGVSGIAPDTTLQPVRALGSLGGTTSDLVDAIRWAAGLSVPGVADNPFPAQVLNMSLGGAGACSPIWQQAIDDAVAAGSTIVVAAGNSSSTASGFTPASCDNVIAVAATGPTGDLAYYSNYGPLVDLSAPGGDAQLGGVVLSTVDSGARIPEADAYTGYQGTSMASPHVAGVVALMLSLNPTLTPSQIEAILKDTAHPFPGSSSCASSTWLCGAGIVDAAAAVYAVAQ
jgi:serine protease